MFMTHSVAQTKPAKHFIVYLPFYRQRDLNEAAAAADAYACSSAGMIG